MDDTRNLKVSMVLTVVICTAVIVFSTYLFTRGGRDDSGTGKDAERAEELANELYSRGLYEQAATAYEKMLELGGMGDAKRANVHFKTAELFREKLYDCDRAVPHYLQVKPAGKLDGAVNQGMVECLEKLGRSRDAQLELDRLVNVKKEGQETSGTVIARIGESEISQSELDGIIELAGGKPDEMTGPEKAEMLRHYIARQLIVNSARRKGYHKDIEIKRRIDDFEKNLLFSRVYSEDVSSKVNLDESDVKLYYENHKDEFKDEEGNEKTFEEVESQVRMKARMEKEQEEFQRLLGRMMEAEQVEIFDEKIK